MLPVRGWGLGTRLESPTCASSERVGSGHETRELSYALPMCAPSERVGSGHETRELYAKTISLNVQYCLHYSTVCKN